MGSERRSDMTGLLCPGQGSQFVGMGRDLADAFPAAREAFEEADDALGFSLSRLCWEGPEEELTLTKNAQPAILVHSIAVWRVLQAEKPLSVALGAGHSLGEFSAYTAAGTFDLADAVRCVRRRGELMFESGSARPGTMAAVLGLDDAAAENACREASAEGGGVVIPANYNSPGQLVISGDVGAVEKASELLKQAGAKRVVTLNVSGAFHSPLMEVAVDGLRETLDGFSLRDPAFPVISNVTTEPVADAGTARELLLRQLTSPVRWSTSVQRMRQDGIASFVEIGPGSVLTGLLKRIDRGATGRSLGTAAEVTAYLSEES
jgi:[acyl-carrier-protein] S-malonyltransferase